METPETAPLDQPADYPAAVSARDEIWNTLTHFPGFVLSVGAVPILIMLAALYGDIRQVVTFSIYSAALILTYLVSTCYHFVKPGRLKHALRRADHITIYLLIAGTYTPFLIVAVGGAWGWSLFGVQWGLAFVGFLTKLKFGHRYDGLSTVAYVLMGWIGLVAFVPLIHSLPLPSLVLVITGGVAYTVGAVFYAWEKLPLNHAIWHLFCLAGSIQQCIAVFFLLRL
ncbi:MAG TPA: hemolysin III family protein [Gammaproteobacteria bacterium]|nr:hemolysin III family protein [Gammaproteobacteria bacterium]